MSTFFDTLMLILFVLFMFFIFGGYHRQKFEEREAERKKDAEAGSDSDVSESTPQ